MIPEPFIATTGIHNFRDYGGYAVSGGGRIRHGLLYRSGHHVEASEEDLAAIAALDIRTVIDLRGASERSRFPCRRVEGFAGEVLFYEGETASSPPHMDVEPGITTAQYARERMTVLYTRMPRNPAMITMFSRYFDALDRRDGASLVHCFAGKDRTGIAASLLLHVLGASREDMTREFVLTNAAPTFHILKRQSLPGIEERLGRTLDDEAARALLEVRAEYLDTYIAEIEADHGSLDAFLRSAIGVDDAMRARLRARFVA